MSATKLLDLFNANYNYLYDNDGAIAGYAVLVDAGAAYCERFRDVYLSICRARFDALTSDRELAAFALVVCDLDLV